MLRRYLVELKEYKINEKFSKKQMIEIDAECSSIIEIKDYIVD